MFDEVKVFSPDVFTDYRGDIWTVHEQDKFPADLNFNHDKYSVSRRNVIRGIHGDFKTWKLVSCLYGDLYFVVVDNREDSKNYLKHYSMILDDKKRKTVLLPPGFGNGFCALSHKALFSYKLAYDGEYSDVEQQFTLKWNDPRLNIDWPISDPILQKRDK